MEEVSDPAPVPRFAAHSRTTLAGLVPTDSPSSLPHRPLPAPHPLWRSPPDSDLPHSPAFHTPEKAPMTHLEQVVRRTTEL